MVTRFAPASTDARSAWANFWQAPGSNAPTNPMSVFFLAAGRVDGTYPMSNTSLYPISSSNDRSQLWRQFQNDMGAITPVGQEWDIPRFQATPLRLISESLVLQANASGYTLPTAAVARYPMWCGRSLDFDNLSDGQLKIMYSNLTLPGSTPPAGEDAVLYSLDTLMQSWMPLYPTRRVNPSWQPGSPPSAPNPYGYQVQVYDDIGNRVYGSNYNSSAHYTMINTRHFMDWPPIDRPDWSWSAPSSYLWSQNDVSRQRLEGRLVFAQSVVPSQAAAQNLNWQLPSYIVSTPATLTPQNQQMQLPATYQAGTPVILPIPTGYWQYGLTRLVTPPSQITLSDQNGDTVIFHLVNKTPAQLNAGEYCASTTTNLNGVAWQAGAAYTVGTTVQPPTPNGFSYKCIAAGSSGASQPAWPSSGTCSDGSVTWRVIAPVYRELTFGPLPATTLGLQVTWGTVAWGIGNANAQQAWYTVSDLQPDDVVVATYSTKAVIDLALTVSRQDRAGQLSFSRQDFSVNRRITADNALKRARDNH